MYISFIPRFDITLNSTIITEPSLFRVLVTVILLLLHGLGIFSFTRASLTFLNSH